MKNLILQLKLKIHLKKKKYEWKRQCIVFDGFQHIELAIAINFSIFGIFQNFKLK